MWKIARWLKKTAIRRTFDMSGALLILSELVFSERASAGQPLPWQLGFQPPASPIMEDIVSLNNYLLVVIAVTICFVLSILGFVIWRFNTKRNPTPATWSHHTLLEIGWTVIPILVLMTIAIPSFRLLYRQDQIPPANLTIKVEGHQWYWSYTYPDFGIAFDSTMLETEQLSAEQPRLLSSDTAVVVPVGQVVRIQLTADDVLHSWAVPALGVKTDAIPGRLNETWFQVSKPGLYYGYCAELCGTRHAYMPVVVQAIPQTQFDTWLAEHRKIAGSSPQSFSQEKGKNYSISIVFPIHRGQQKETSYIYTKV